MTKCKNCGAEFDSKFCPNCGAPAADAEKNAVAETGATASAAAVESDEWVATDLEKQIRSRGAAYAWRKNSPRDFKGYVALVVAGVAVLAALVTVTVLLAIKIYDLTDLDAVKLLLYFDAYISDIKSLSIALSVLLVVNGVSLFFNSYFRNVKICKWLKAQDINAPQIILAGAVENGGILDSDKDEFVETKRYLYDAKCEGAQAEKKYLRLELADAIINTVCNIISVVILFQACNALEITKDGRLELPMGQLIAILVLMIVPSVIMRFVNKGVKMRESDIDAWARKQENEQRKARESA